MKQTYEKPTVENVLFGIEENLAYTQETGSSTFTPMPIDE